MIARIVLRTAAFAAVAVLASCGGEQHRDLKKELDELTKNERGRVPPLPPTKDYKPVPYAAVKQPDPFRPDRIDAVQGGNKTTTSKLAPDTKRPREPLEAFALDAIQMLGTIKQNNEIFALVKAGPNLFRVRKGMYMGQSFGVITAIDDSQISIRELVQDGGGEWTERASALQLVEAKR
jgi:type IV pilus assembly protein PilP